MTTRTAGRSKSGPAYLRLVRECPLRPIRSDAELERAHAVLDRLFRESDPPDEVRDYIEVLSDLAEKYEREVYPIPDASDADMLGYLMTDRDWTQTALAERSGIAQSTISAVLRGTKKLTREHIVTLAQTFGVPPAVFLTTAKEI